MNISYRNILIIAISFGISTLFGCATPVKKTEPIDLNQKIKSGEAVPRVDNFLIILDTSGSMARSAQGKEKVEVARDILLRMNRMIPDIPLTCALRTYGKSRSLYQKRTTDLIYWPFVYSRKKFADELKQIKWSGGKSLIEHAIEAVTNDLEPIPGDTALILMTDGKIDPDNAVAAMKKVKETFSDRIHLAAVHILNPDDDIQQNALDRKNIEKVLQVMGNGFCVSSMDLVTEKGMADFVEKVFLDTDKDGDGIGDSRDICPGTPENYKVDKKGCPLDTDGDGILDGEDNCPDTPEKAPVDKKGCPLDTDADGIPDYMDRCGDTPATIQVGEDGCPKDSDGDGVPDFSDKCPNTPEIIAVDAWGCPIDKDSDGVPDSMDDCPKTPERAQVDSHGCALDSDGDGVFDYLDACPNTPRGNRVNDKGCPVSERSMPLEPEKVFGYIGEDMETAAPPQRGMPVESMTDEAPLEEQRIDITGAESEKMRRPTLKKDMSESDRGEEKQESVSPEALLFSPDRAEINPAYQTYLDRIVDMMRQFPSMKLEISGHSDSEEAGGKSEQLSKQRADAVLQYLVRHGIDAARIIERAFGHSRPRNSNLSPVGRADNRRVEFRLIMGNE